MSEQIEMNELEALKKRADMMGIEYHPKIGLDSLKRKIEAKLGAATEEPAVVEKPSATGRAIRPATKSEIANFKRKQANRLVRVEVTNMNPNKREWEGEIITAGNSVIGSIRKYIPFNTPTHIPIIIYNAMKERKCQVFYSVKDKFGTTVKKAKLIPEFGFRELPPLTKEELKTLAAAQLAVNGSDAA